MFLCRTLDEGLGLLSGSFACGLRLESGNIRDGDGIAIGEHAGKDVDDQSVHDDLLSVVTVEHVEAMPIACFDAVLQAGFQCSTLDNFPELFGNNHVASVLIQPKLDLKKVGRTDDGALKHNNFVSNIAPVLDQIDQISAVCLHGCSLIRVEQFVKLFFANSSKSRIVSVVHVFDVPYDSTIDPFHRFIIAEKFLSSFDLVGTVHEDDLFGPHDQVHRKRDQSHFDRRSARPSIVAGPCRNICSSGTSKHSCRTDEKNSGGDPLIRIGVWGRQIKDQVGFARNPDIRSLWKVVHVIHF